MRNNIIFQIFKKCFQNLQLFSINRLKTLMFMQIAGVAIMFNKKYFRDPSSNLENSLLFLVVLE